ncbi:hypothetical protein [Inhella crocodyli]|uniref:Uncharacterized protein n=1 Tax=Inhella crocodyli TaxID=2499851 RepID=A0A3S2XR42_9BURK|nr:hypothetical protein [Inhella crocodyli]RVT84950.1 hypothetical protein EOD73_12595 [Inhella crocodyli]
MAPRVWNPYAPTASATTPPLPRASLDGLEVQDSSFDHWLESGGERRRRPRTAGSAADRGRVPLETGVQASGWDRLGDALLKS